MEVELNTEILEKAKKELADEIGNDTLADIIADWRRNDDVMYNALRESLREKLSIDLLPLSKSEKILTQCCGCGQITEFLLNKPDRCSFCKTRVFIRFGEEKIVLTDLKKSKLVQKVIETEVLSKDELEFINLVKKLAVEKDISPERIKIYGIPEKMRNDILRKKWLENLDEIRETMIFNEEREYTEFLTFEQIEELITLMKGSS